MTHDTNRKNIDTALEAPGAPQNVIATDAVTEAHAGGQTAHDPHPNLPPFGVRRMGAVNTFGVWTLYQKEVRRFLKVMLQTVFAPAIMTMLFMVIFTVALGREGRIVLGQPFTNFLAPGLMVMGLMQNAFANTSSSILIGKVQGTIVDVLMPPMGPGELVTAYVAGGVTRGVLVAASVSVAMFFWPGVSIGVAHGWAIIYFALSAAIMMSLIGILTGIWADKFDHAAAITNFIIQPLSILSGTFYSIERLPENWQAFCHLNPFFYLIDGFRYGIIGRADGDVLTGALVCLGLNIVLWLLCLRVFQRGYRIKS
ncbi:MAG: ABC transporter permease [Pseudomonadota bacterium]